MGTELTPTPPTSVGPGALPPEVDDGPMVGLVDLLTWLGEGKRLIAIAVAAAAALSVVVALLLPNEYTARATMLPPGSQQQGGSAAALAALGALGGLAGGLAAKTPDELYVSLLRSDSVVRALDERFKLRQRYEVDTVVELKLALQQAVRVSADRKSGVIAVEVDDEDPAFAAELANAHAEELMIVLGRLAVSEAQQRRMFFEQQLARTKENLVKAEQEFRALQERSGVIVLDKQAEAMLVGAAQVRAQIAEREVQLRVLRASATAQNPDVLRLASEIAALRSELARMESPGRGNGGSAVDLPVGQLPAAAIEYVRARRELKIQETLLESMVRQYEIAKLDEAKDGPVLQTVDRALPPDRKSKPKRALIVMASVMAALLASALFVISRAYLRLARAQDPSAEAAWSGLLRAWRWRG
ncbi:MAG: Wzz/FepE/Etk N-terminal domain-containing protein [Ideonella sp.]|nr:Wzz/FepE/Etk N-terminal domain-containing protein [Ideonella sp.]